MFFMAAFVRNKLMMMMMIIKQYGDWYTALAVDGWAVTFGTARRAWAGCSHAESPPHCTKCNSPSINGLCTNFIIII